MNLMRAEDTFGDPCNAHVSVVPVAKSMIGRPGHVAVTEIPVASNTLRATSPSRRSISKKLPSSRRLRPSPDATSRPGSGVRCRSRGRNTPDGLGAYSMIAGQDVSPILNLESYAFNCGTIRSPINCRTSVRAPSGRSRPPLAPTPGPGAWRRCRSGSSARVCRASVPGRWRRRSGSRFRTSRCRCWCCSDPVPRRTCRP